MMKNLFLPLFLLLSSASGANDTSALKKFSAQQIKQDLVFMVRSMEEVHPNIFHSISRADLERKLDSVSATISDGMTVEEAWPKFAALIGAINEGHTSLSWPSSYTSPERRSFPVYMKDFDGTAFIVRFDASEENVLLPGDRIVAINGESAYSIAKRYHNLQGGLDPWKNLMISFQLRHYLAMSRFTDPYTLRYMRDGKEQSVVLKAQTNKDLNEKIAAYRRSNATLLTPYSFSIPGDGIGYMHFRSMDNEDRFAKFADSVFREIEEHDLHGVIIDLRQNGGGNSALGDELLSYITKKRYRMAAAMKWKISQRYKDYYNSLPDNRKFLKGSPIEKQYLSGKNNEFVTVSSNTVKPRKQKNRFKGPVCFLTGPNTFSSANMLANAVKDYKLATIIGEPTGECPNDYGELLTIRTPVLGIEFSTSTKQYIRANGDEKNRDPILPDHFVKDDPSTAVDETLEFAKDWVRKQK